MFVFFFTLYKSRQIVSGEASPLYFSTAHSLPPLLIVIESRQPSWPCCLTACPLSLLLIIIGILFGVLLIVFRYPINRQHSTPLQAYCFSALYCHLSLLCSRKKILENCILFIPIIFIHKLFHTWILIIIFLFLKFILFVISNFNLSCHVL